MFAIREAGVKCDTQIPDFCAPRDPLVFEVKRRWSSLSIFMVEVNGHCFFRVDRDVCAIGRNNCQADQYWFVT